MGSNGTLLERAILRPVAKSTTYTARPFDLVYADVSGGSFTVTLPSAHAPGDIVGIKLDTPTLPNTVTLARDGSNTIEGATSIVLYVDSDYLEVVWTGSTWLIAVDARIKHFAKMYNSVAQNVASGSIVPMVFDTAPNNNAGLASITSDNFTIRRAGAYRVKTYANCPNLDDGEVLGLLIYNNGASIENQGEWSPGTDKTVDVITSWEGSLAAADVITIQIFQNEGGAQNLGNATDTVAWATVEELR